ncbi:GAF domain-containing protein, partial [Bradyrhizobium japonicum]
MSDISRENYDFLNSAKALSEMKGLICVPISIGQERIGVLVLHQFHSRGKLVEHDLQLLQGFADQTAVAIENARLYREAKTALHELAELSGQLQSRNQYLLKRNEIHDTLQQLTLQNKGVDAIIQTLQRMIGKPVSFIDCLQNQYYPQSAATRPTYSIDELSMIFSNRRTPVTLLLGKNNSACHYAYPIINGAVFFGCLTVETKLIPLPELDQIAIEQGSAILALELVKQQTISSIFYKKTHEFFQKLLQEKDPDALYARGQELGLSPSAAYSVVLFHLTPVQDLQQLDASVHRLVAMLKRRHKSIEQLVYGFHNHVTMLVSMNQQAVSQLIKQLGPMLKEWEQIESISL